MSQTSWQKPHCDCFGPFLWSPNSNETVRRNQKWDSIRLQSKSSASSLQQTHFFEAIVSSQCFTTAWLCLQPSWCFPQKIQVTVPICWWPKQSPECFWCNTLWNQFHQATGRMGYNPSWIGLTRDPELWTLLTLWDHVDIQQTKGEQTSKEGLLMSFKKLFLKTT